MRVMTLIASTQSALFSMVPASTKRDTGVPSCLIERRVKVDSKFLENKNEDDGDFVRTGGEGNPTLSSRSGEHLEAHSMVVSEVMRHSPLRVT
jgi:hypothetical protein